MIFLYGDIFFIKQLLLDVLEALGCCFFLIYLYIIRHYFELIQIVHVHECPSKNFSGVYMEPTEFSILGQLGMQSG